MNSENKFVRHYFVVEIKVGGINMVFKPEHKQHATIAIIALFVKPPWNKNTKNNKHAMEAKIPVIFPTTFLESVAITTSN